MIRENIKHEELMQINSDSPDFRRALAIGLTRFNRAVHVTILELDDLFQNIQVKHPPEYSKKNEKEKCRICTKYIHCIDHMTPQEVKSVQDNLFLGYFGSNVAA